MATTRLQDDLLQEFRAEHQFVSEQIDLFDPLATSLRQPVARRLLSKGMLIFLELFCYLAALAGIAFIFLLDKLHPFYLVPKLSVERYRQQLGPVLVQHFTIAFYAVTGVSVLLLYIIARMIRRVRLKNDILQMAGKNIKTLVGDLLRRKAALEAIEQRHFTELPVIPAARPASPGINSIPNPGFDTQQP